MNAEAEGLQRYLESVKYRSQPLWMPPSHPSRIQRRVVTISRQAGSGAHVVAEELVSTLQARARPGAAPWTVFDRNLVERVLKDHELPERLAEFMPEDRVSGIADTLDELFGVHPLSWTLVRKTADTILRLAELGNVVLIGRGATVITGKLEYVFRVRLVGSVERRVEHVQEYLHLDRVEAAEYVRKQDQGRKRYVKKYYAKDIEDPLLYHVVINTDRVPYSEAGRMIADAVSRRPDEATPVTPGASRGRRSSARAT